MFPKKSFIIILCSSFMFLTACGYKQYEVPQLEDKGLPSQEIMAQYDVDRNWWQHYDDEQLNELLNIALTNNIDILDAISTLKRTFIAMRYNEGSFIPSASGSAGVNASKNIGTSEDISSITGSFYTGLSLDLSFWHSLPTLNASKWVARASAEDLESVRLSVAYGLIDAYFTLMYYHQVHSLSLENITFLEKVLKTVQFQHVLGSVDELEPLTAMQALNTANENLISAEIDINDTLVLIRNYLNINHSEPLTIHPVNIMRIKTVAPDLDVPLETLALRPDIRQAEFLAYSALEELKVAHRAWIPSISIGSTFSSSGNLNANSTNVAFLNPSSFALGGAFNITLPFLSWWNIKWNVKEYENYMEQSLNAFTSQINQALNELQAIYYSYKNEKKLFELSQEKTGIDRKIFEYRKFLYDEGRDDLKTWLEANTDMNNSRENLLLAKLSLIRKENALYQAMGGRILKKNKDGEHNSVNTTENKSTNQNTKHDRENSMNLTPHPAIGEDVELEKKRAEERATQKIDGNFRPMKPE